MGDNERLTQAKIAFFENKYMPFLSQNGIECQRSHNQAINSGNNYHGGHSSNMYGGNMYQHQQENYFASGQEPGQGQFDDNDDDDDNAANAGVQRQNSRDADLYDDDDINEGGNAGVDNIADQVAASGVLEDNDDDNDNDENMMVDDQNEEEQMLADV